MAPQRFAQEQEIGEELFEREPLPLPKLRQRPCEGELRGLENRIVDPIGGKRGERFQHPGEAELDCGCELGVRDAEGRGDGETGRRGEGGIFTRSGRPVSPAPPLSLGRRLDGELGPDSHDQVALAIQGDGEGFGVDALPIEKHGEAQRCLATAH